MSVLHKFTFAASNVRILAATAASLLPVLSLGQSTDGGAIRTWVGTGNGNFQNAPNWGGATFVPDFSDGEASTTGISQPAGTDSIFFDNNINTLITLNAPNANNTGTSLYTLRSISFGENAGAFSFQTTNARVFVLGDSTDPLASPDNTGNILNDSTSTQTFNVPVRFRFGTVDAAEGQIVFQQAVNIGNNLSEAVNNLTVTGSSEIPNQSIVTISGPLQGTGTDTSAGGALIKDGTGTLILSGDSSAVEWPDCHQFRGGSGRDGQRARFLQRKNDTGGGCIDGTAGAVQNSGGHDFHC
jgi:hypothetical protein